MTTDFNQQLGDLSTWTIEDVESGTANNEAILAFIRIAGARIKAAEPLPPKLASWVGNAMVQIGAGVPPDKAFGLWNGNRRANSRVEESSITIGLFDLIERQKMSFAAAFIRMQATGAFGGRKQSAIRKIYNRRLPEVLSALNIKRNRSS